MRARERERNEEDISDQKQQENEKKEEEKKHSRFAEFLCWLRYILFSIFLARREINNKSRIKDMQLYW